MLSFLSHMVEKTSLNKVLRKKHTALLFRKDFCSETFNKLVYRINVRCVHDHEKERKLNGNKRAGERCIYLNLARTNGSCSPEGTATTLGTEQLHWKAGVPEINDHMCGLRCLLKLLGYLSTLLLLAVRRWVSLAVRMSSLLAYVISITVYSFNAEERAEILKIPASVL